MFRRLIISYYHPVHTLGLIHVLLVYASLTENATPIISIRIYCLFRKMIKQCDKVLLKFTLVILFVLEKKIERSLLGVTKIAKSTCFATLLIPNINANEREISTLP